MRPTLYSGNESAFTSNGLGVLSDAIRCVVTEERNGSLELEMEYPITGAHYGDIAISRIIKARSAPGGEPQLFRIYSITKPLSGRVTVNAEHISYQLSYIPVAPFSAGSAAEALSKMKTNAMTACPFTFWTDKETVASYSQGIPGNIRARLGGERGSILDIYGGEYEFDNYTVKLHNHRGQDRGVTLRYGKNITDIEQEENIASTYTSIVGYWQGDNEMVYTQAIDSASAASFPYKRVQIVDFSGDYEEKPSVETLSARATAYMEANGFGIPKVSIKVSFISLDQTEEYRAIAPLERVYLCDTLTVQFEKLGISATAKVVKTTYDALRDRYESIEVGEARANLTDRVADQGAAIKGAEAAIERVEGDVATDIERAVDSATRKITGENGGYLLDRFNADGQRYELLIMDTNNPQTAEKVWRWNLSGWGYSSTGINGPYTLAATQDGAIVADFITTGTLTAALIKAGVLSDSQGKNSWNMQTGELVISSSAEVSDGTAFSQIRTNANSISAEVTRATGAEASIITQTATAIETAVTGVAHNYTGAYRPTASNSPASGWSANDKAKHINDVFFDSSTGKSYRWTQSPKDGIKLKFNSQSKTENGYDYVYVYYLKNGTYYRHSTKLTGTGIANAEVFVPSSTAYVYWYSDSSATEWGFKIDSVSYVQDGTASYSSATLPRAVDKTVDMYDLPETAHPYTNGEAYTWQVNTDYSVSNGDSWGWVLVENQDINSRILQSADGIKTEVQGLDGQVSSISQRADSIEISVGNKVDKSSVIASINASQETVKISASKVTITGYVTFSDLSTAGQTTINGSNITTGTLNANLITTGSMSAARITSGILQDANANMTLNLSTGQISAKKLSVSSTNFTLTEAGVMTATGATINGTVKSSSGSSVAELSSARLIFKYSNSNIGFIETDGVGLFLSYDGNISTGGFAYLTADDARIEYNDGYAGYGVSVSYNGIWLRGPIKTRSGSMAPTGFFYDRDGNQINVENGLITSVPYI